MEYSKSGLALTEQFENCRLAAYQDVRGRWTIGYGHAEGVTPGQVITQQQAEALLLEDVQTAANCVNNAVKVPLTQTEFDALVDFTYNAGGGAFKGSTMLKLLNGGDYAGAAAQFDRWDEAGGQVVAGLFRRRQAETTEFGQNG
jgi:lysozyme